MDIDLFFLYISKRNVYYKTQNATKWKLFFYFLGKIHMMRVNCQLEFCVFQVTRVQCVF